MATFSPTLVSLRPFPVSRSPGQGILATALAHTQREREQDFLKGGRGVADFSFSS